MRSPQKSSPLLCLGTTTFGANIGQKESLEILDFYFDNGGSYLDTADNYSQWYAGNKGGEAEVIIGSWIRLHKNRRENIFLGSKVGKSIVNPGLKPENIKQVCIQSLKRLGTEYLDILYFHEPDSEVSLEESLLAACQLYEQGKILSIGVSNFNLEQIEKSRKILEKIKGPPLSAIQNHYNLLERDGNLIGYDLYSERTNNFMESKIIPALDGSGITIFAYHALARGFLTGKYLSNPNIESVHSSKVSKYLDERGISIARKVDDLADLLSTSCAGVSLAWLRAQYVNMIPVISVRDTRQLAECMVDVALDSEQIKSLSNLS
jgi:aryl-alcohol dehydrogenase-like predicted oxidoreductase